LEEYLCPGQRQPIFRAVHLGRLAAFYPPCRTCPHRDDNGSLSPRQIEQLQEVHGTVRPASVFHHEGAGGVYWNDFTPGAARQVAIAFTTTMLREESSSNDAPLLAIGGDGRAITAEWTAAVGDGIRATGCHVVDIGPATSSCLAFAIRHLRAAGGILVGNPTQQPHIVCLQFWNPRPCPLSLGSSLDAVVATYEANDGKTARTFGRLQRFQADEPYLAAVQEYYHALRPLRIVMNTASQPFGEYLQRLAANVACQVIPCRGVPEDLPNQIRIGNAHLAVSIDGDGETCQVFDERGQPVPSDRLLRLLAIDVLRENPAATTWAATDPIATTREMAAKVMASQNAVLGLSANNRFWHSLDGIALPDALMTVTRLLLSLSRSDEAFSVLLDRAAQSHRPLGEG
jgi:phosphomannomutase